MNNKLEIRHKFDCLMLDQHEEVYWNDKYIGFLYKTISGANTIALASFSMEVSELKEIFKALDDYLKCTC